MSEADNIIAWGIARVQRLLCQRGEPRIRIRKGKKNHATAWRKSLVSRSKYRKRANARKRQLCR